MKKFIFFLFFVILLIIPSGIVLGQNDACPTDIGWYCSKIPDGVSTEGLVLIAEYDFPIQKVWIDGFFFENDSKKEDCFFVTGLGTKRVEVLSNCSSIREMGEYVPSKPTATPVVTTTPTNTATSVATATVYVTSTPRDSFATELPVVTQEPINTIPATNPIVLLIVGLSFLALAAIIIIALIVRKNAKH